MRPGYHVKKSKVRRKFYVVLIGLNGEPLSTSELLNSEQTAWENIAAQLRAARIEAALRTTDGVDVEWPQESTPT